MNKILVNIVVPYIDNSFDVELPINLEMEEAINLIQKAINELSNNAYVIRDNVKLYDKSTGCVVNNNNIVKFSGLKNGASVMLI